MSGTGSLSAPVSASGNAIIDGILGHAAWAGDTLTFGFAGETVSRFDPVYRGYAFSGEAQGVYAPTGAIRTVIAGALDADAGPAARAGLAVEGFTALNISETTSGEARINIAQTSTDPYGYGTAWAYYPSERDTGGDVWFSDTRYDFSKAQIGTYSGYVMMHELGHALGLDHGHDEDHHDDIAALPHDLDSMEYSLMTYRSYVGASGLSLSNGADSYAQSWMMADIAALQHLYGADFSANAGNTTYSWRPDSGQTVIDGVVAIDPAGLRIFATLWDGGGIDTYDLSAYSTDLSIDLAPGAASLFSAAQAANLGHGHLARGNIYNALQHDGDVRSLIENAIGGAGDDDIAGNHARNRLSGGEGNDTLSGLAGNDVLAGQAGDDRLFGGAGRDKLFGHAGNDKLFGEAGRDVLRGGAGDDLLCGGTGADRLVGGEGADTFRFLAGDSLTGGKRHDRIVDFSSGEDLIDLITMSEAAPMGLTFADLSLRDTKNGSRILIDLDGDGLVDQRIDMIGCRALTSDDFLF
ncbi:MAG: protease [Pseudooceanicola sp.]|jgi:serralysin|nr:protease [Pseudooceanicola sp.]